MREVVLDTETTGLDPFRGHRIIEIGCLELENHIPTGKTFQRYINPERDIPAESTRITGITYADVRDKPVIADVIDDFLAFIGDSPLIIHNAVFDMKFLNAELKTLNRQQLPMSRAIDTLRIARQKFPGSPASLDALCKRFSVDNTMRDKHGALLDSYLLADVYLELIGGRQRDLNLLKEKESHDTEVIATTKPILAPRTFPINAQDVENHRAFLAKISDPLWRKIEE